jgi:hypothetical protein
MRYYIDGKEVTTEKAKTIEAKNQELLQLAEATQDLSVLLGCKFICKV